MYELKIEINRLSDNINKREQNAGENSLYQECKIKNFYLEHKIIFLKHELSLKQNTIDKLLEISSSQCKDIISCSKEKRKKSIDIAKNIIAVANS